MNSAAPRSCIVIGAGLAGLAATRFLALRGWSVTVLEAGAKLGGRVVSYRFKEAPSLVCELGGEWIGRDHTRMIELCKELRLETMSHRYGFRFWRAGSGLPRRAYPPGAWPFSRHAKKEFKAFGRALNLYSEAEKIQLDRLDWWSQLRLIGFTEDELRSRDLMDSTDFGESIRMISAYAGATEYVESNSTDEMDRKIVGGNDQLPEALAADIRRCRGQILTGVFVVAVKQSNRGVKVYVREMEQPYKAELCICATATRALTLMEWDPVLPEDQYRAALELQYARIVKTAILCPTRFWPRTRRYGFSVFTDRVSDFCFDATFGQEGEEGILCSYAIGDKADDVASERRDDIAEWVIQDVGKACLIPNLPRHRDVKRCSWQRDTLTGGSYAIYRPGQWFTVRSILQRPHHRVFFAGEHLADWQGFMEGAVQSGEATAATVLRQS